MTPGPVSSTVSFADWVLLEWFCPPSRKSFPAAQVQLELWISISCPWFSLPICSLPFPWPLPFQRKAVLLVCLSSLLQQWLCKGNSGAPSLLFCHLKAHPVLSTKCQVYLCVTERELSRTNVFSYGWLLFDLMTLSPAGEDLGGQLQPFSKTKSFGRGNNRKS